MKFGVREICDVVFKAKKSGRLGSYKYVKDQPVLYIDSAKASTLESASTTVYAQGGKGNSRLIAWEGEKTLTFTVEDALISERGLAILTGAGLYQYNHNKFDKKILSHCFEEAQLEIKMSTGSLGSLLTGSLQITLELKNSIANIQDVFILCDNGELFSPNWDLQVIGDNILRWNNILENVLSKYIMDMINGYIKDAGYPKGATLTTFVPVKVDYYTEINKKVSDFVIQADNFADTYYVEANTKFKRAYDGKDLDAVITLPNVKVQSNFTFSMAASGDPSTFSFVMDAMPGYTLNNPNKKVLCEMFIVDKKISNIDSTKKDSVDYVVKSIEEGGQYSIDTIFNSGATMFSAETLGSETAYYGTAFKTTAMNDKGEKGDVIISFKLVQTAQRQEDLSGLLTYSYSFSNESGAINITMGDRPFIDLYDPNRYDNADKLIEVIEAAEEGGNKIIKAFKFKPCELIEYTIDQNDDEPIWTISEDAIFEAIDTNEIVENYSAFPYFNCTNIVAKYPV